MSAIDLVILQQGGARLAVLADDVVVVRDRRAEDAGESFDLDKLLGMQGDAGETERALEISVRGGALVGTSRCKLALFKIEADDCFSVPRVLRSAGCASWLRGFIIDRQASSVLPWIDVAGLLIGAYTERMFFAQTGDS